MPTQSTLRNAADGDEKAKAKPILPLVVEETEEINKEQLASFLLASRPPGW